MKRIIFILSILNFTLLFLVPQNTSNPYSQDELKKMLTPVQYRVTQFKGTEQAFQNEYWDNLEPGIYVDVISGKPLFSSLDQYQAGTGWPAFSHVLVKENIMIQKDYSFYTVRLEVRSVHADSHLGYLEEDPVSPTGERYTINSAALRFIPLQEIANAGMEKYLILFDNLKQVDYEIATLGGGCFWGVQHIMGQLEGVHDTVVGYMGGHVPNPSYSDVFWGKTGHAEVVQIYFDPDVISYAEILDYFWRLHNPTLLNKQGNDVGDQYRSVIFYHSEEQHHIAEESKKAFDEKKIFPDKAVTQIQPAVEFYVAEDYDQDYYIKKGGRVCHTLRDE